MKENGTQISSLMRLAQVLKAFFENKFKTELLFVESSELKPDGDPLAHDGQLANLLALDLSHLGIYGLHSKKPLRLQDQQEIKSTLKETLGELREQQIRTRDKSEDLLRLTAQLEAMTDELPSNVIPLRRPGASSSPFSRVKDNRWILKLDCLIESTNPEDIHKMAMELHFHSGRYAFIEFGDLLATDRIMVSELAKLGALTVYIPNIVTLTAQEQKTLIALTELDTLNRPLLMVGTHLPYSELRCLPQVNLDFLSIVSRAYIKLSRPFEHYKQQNLIHYFLDSLSDSST